ncbi:NfeD family protein [Pseudonocardia sp. TRM90224]|uniref:NfeD family protein n=1 Tax=Pseudonocardia sp. TRM90224 TaxID=2812678 RepID=UPI001E289A8E|nr:NfeD family protein [Pseudonocardia sp. TRM90224]
MWPAIIWLIAGIVLLVAEVASGEFVLLMLGGGALAAAGVSALVGGPVVGAIVFVVVSVLLVFVVRPALRRKLDRGIDHTSTNSRALVGRDAVVVKEVDGHGGRVKIGGDIWSARTYGDVVIAEGQRVTVAEISGATAVVVPQES